jgi:GNAT superfamily N-acetyltransferase
LFVPDPTGDPRLEAHLRAYLGVWPPATATATQAEVVGSVARVAPAWDGAHLPAIVVRSPIGTVVSVRPETVGPAQRVADELDPAEADFPSRLADAVGAPGRVSPWLPLRWSVDPAPLADVGEWVDVSHPALPDWLRAFASPVLVALDGDGAYLGGVGLKPHTDHGIEVAVGTAEAARGRGVARRLVAQAGRWLLAKGVVPLYVHAPDNVPSARVADAAGFPDRGWRMLVMWEDHP